MKRNVILVVGGAGFIGSHTVDLLLQEGAQVIVLDNLSSGRLDNLDLSHPNLEFIEGDALEFPLVLELVEKCDAVLNLAAITSVPFSIEEPIYSFQVNTQGFLHTLEAVRLVKRPIRFVYASSAAVYGVDAALPCRDDLPLTSAPISPYALQKRHDEDYANLYWRLHQKGSLGLRYFNVYGPRQVADSPYSGVISRFLDAYQKDTAITIYGDGTQSRDFIYVGDIARANVLALQSDYTGVLNIATGKAQTLLQLADYIEAAGNRPIKRQFAPPRQGDIHASYADVRLAGQQLEFRSLIELKEGIREMIVL
jgi:nucleoside-diphosphate-sugar epimerase